MQQYLIYALAGSYALMSLIAFLCYGHDKKLAKQKKWRTPEKTLLLLGFLGGSIGALAGMQVFRHKTKHWYFHAVNLAGLVWQAGLLLFLLLRQQDV